MTVTFHLNNGQPVYLEIGSLYEKAAQRIRGQNDGMNYGMIRFCHYTFNDDDCNKHCIPDTINRDIEYTLPSFLAFVNSLGCNFDRVEILDDLYGYRVFGELQKHYFGDEFKPNKENRQRVFLMEDHFARIEKEEGKEYPNFNLWIDETDNGMVHLVRHFNGYNRHWTIRRDTDRWLETVQECHLGKYGC